MGSLFAVLDIEEKLQVGDKTRFDAQKSFVSPAGATALTTLTVRPGLDYGAALNIFSSTESDRYLDYMFSSLTIDIITGFNDKLDFSQGGALVATLTQGTYTLNTLCTHIASVLNAVGGISGTFSVSISEKHKITISNDTESFELLPNGVNFETSILTHIGFRKSSLNTLNGSSVVGKPVEYGHKQIACVAGDGTTTSTVNRYVQLYDKIGDHLFSSDQDLIVWEPDIMRWVQVGRSTFLNIHRTAQDQILKWLDKEGYTNVYQEKYTKFDIIDISEVNEWSTFMALSIIFWGISNKTDDVFLKKYFEYLNKSKDARQRAVIRLDVDADGIVDVGEQLEVGGGVIITR